MKKETKSPGRQQNTKLIKVEVENPPTPEQAKKMIQKISKDMNKYFSNKKEENLYE